jgi:hypothetical protein
MVLVSEREVLKIINNGPAEGSSNIFISKKILKKNLGRSHDLRSIKVMVSRKSKLLVEQGYLRKIGRKYVISEKGVTRLSATHFSSSNPPSNQQVFSNIYVSFASPSNLTQIIGEKKEVNEALQQLDKAIGDVDVTMLIRQKKTRSNVSRETA